MYWRFIFQGILFLGPELCAVAQNALPSFRHLTPASGLNHESVKTITQDRFGYMWFGGNNGVNRFDAVSMRSYYHNAGDTNALPASLVSCMYSDGRGRLWVGCEPGFAEFDYAKNNFVVYNRTLVVTGIAEDNKGNVWAATTKGLYRVDTVGKRLQPLVLGNDSTMVLTGTSIFDIAADSEGLLFAASGKGLFIINPSAQTLVIIDHLSHTAIDETNDVQQVSVDESHRIWFSTGSVNSKLYCYDKRTNTLRRFDRLFSTQRGSIPNRIMDIFCNGTDKVWLATTYSGLCAFNVKDASIESYTNQSALPTSFSSDFCSTIFRDNNGILWLGAEGSGVDFFQPDRVIFSAIQSTDAEPNALLENWGRDATEDDKGRIWLGTSRGVNVYDPQRGMIKAFTNVAANHRLLPSASVRAMQWDGNSHVWVGTAEGIARISTDLKTVKHYTAKEGIPEIFVHFLYRTKNGRILAGGNKGFYEYQPDGDRFFDYSNLKAFVPYAAFVYKSMWEDTRGNWWLGTARQGLYLFDRKEQTISLAVDTNKFPFIKNAHIQSITEDKSGFIWVGTRTGLIRIHPTRQSIRVITKHDGLPGEWISGIMPDKQGRLWVGTGNGLAVLDGSGKVIAVFTTREGLPSEQFNDQDALQLRDGKFLFPTRKGFVSFDPASYNWSHTQPPVYLSEIAVLNKPFVTSSNAEELSELNLRYNENFFSLTLNSPNYLDPGACWYAYQLEGFDQDWIYTQNPILSYTNIPGGSYVFRYKSSIDRTNWEVVEKQLVIHIGTVFYKTSWFLFLVIALTAVTVFAVYRSRLKRHRTIFELQAKANTLEREKARVQYDALKQQLNPHFLFNSLSSLRSLIRVKPQHATVFLDGLSKTYRYLLGSGDNELVSLKDEIDFVKNYVALQQVRFGDALQVVYQIEDDTLQKSVAPVTLQGLIENAIKHNMLDEEFPLTINIVSRNEWVEVRNNYQPHTRVEGSNKKGLEALKKLYSYYTETPIAVRQEDQAFIVRIPLL